MADKNLMYRKTILKSVYRSSKVFDDVMDYEKYKMAILNSYEDDYKYFHYLKGLHKCHQFLLNTSINKFNPLVLNILYNLIFNKNLDKENQINIIQAKIHNEDIIDNIIEVIKKIKLENKEDLYVFSYAIIVYMIYAKINKMYNLSNVFFKKLYEVITKTKDYLMLKEYLRIEMERDMFPSVEYFDNLREIKPEEIIDFLKDNQQLINEKHKIKSIYLYGSFIKNTYRIDSDIDIAGVFIEDISYEEKLECAKNIKQLILDTFNRHGDFMEYSTTLLKGEKHIKIF